MPLPSPLPAIVLVRPRNPKNIGAAARAMANFGFKDLRVVAPHPPVWEDAQAAAPGARGLLKKARVFKTLSQALKDRRCVWATSALKARRPEIAVHSLRGLSCPPKTAILFGPENNGLDTRDISHAGALVRIPTLPQCPSMNLGQAVALVCYELAGEARPARPAAASGVGGQVPREQLERAADLAARLLEKVGYRLDITAAQREAKVRGMLNRRGLDADEAGFLFEALRKALRTFSP